MLMELSTLLHSRRQQLAILSGTAADPSSAMEAKHPYVR